MGNDLNDFHNLELSGKEKRAWGGKATKCPKGTQAGRRSFTTTPGGSSLLFRHFCKKQTKSEEGTSLSEENKNIQLLYTHGDMVAQLPSCAISLGGNSNVPIQAAAYFSSSNNANMFLATIDKEKISSSAPIIPNETPSKAIIPHV